MCLCERRSNEIKNKERKKKLKMPSSFVIITESYMDN